MAVSLAIPVWQHTLAWTATGPKGGSEAPLPGRGHATPGPASHRFGQRLNPMNFREHADQCGHAGFRARGNHPRAPRSPEATRLSRP